MKKQIDLSLSRKQAILLLWLVENVIDFLSSWSKLDIDCRLDELKDFQDYLNLNLK